MNFCNDCIYAMLYREVQTMFSSLTRWCIKLWILSIFLHKHGMLAHHHVAGHTFFCDFHVDISINNFLSSGRWIISLWWSAVCFACDQLGHAFYSLKNVIIGKSLIMESLSCKGVGGLFNWGCHLVHFEREKTTGFWGYGEGVAQHYGGYQKISL